MPVTSRFTINLVVIFIGLVVLGSIAGAIALEVADKTVPTELWTFGTTALGGLIGMLVNTRTTPDPVVPPVLPPVAK